MYHLKEDKRVKTSAKLICEALNKSLKTKKFNEITIIEIQQKCLILCLELWNTLNYLKR